MDAKLKEKWIAALRSGEYTQATHTLRKEIEEWGSEGYCCLGVLCDILPKGRGEWIDDRFKFNPTAKQKFATKDNVDSYDLLSEVVLDYVGLDADTQEKLAGLNDGGKSFKYIASYIERYVK